MNSKQFLKQVQARHDLHSQYALAKKLGMSQSRVSMYMRGEREFDEQTCLKVSALLDEGPQYVLASIQAERAKSSELKGVWNALAALAKKQKAAAVLAFMVGGWLTAGALLRASDTVLCILCEIGRRRRDRRIPVNLRFTHSRTKAAGRSAVLAALRPRNSLALAVSH